MSEKDIRREQLKRGLFQIFTGLGMIAASLAELWLRITTLAFLFNSFIARPFNIPIVSFWQTFGINLIFAILLKKLNKNYKKYEEDDTDAIFISIGWIITYMAIYVLGTIVLRFAM